MTAVSTFSLFRFPSLADRLWALAQMGAARRPLGRAPGLGFFKLFGSGVGEGFTPAPNTAVWAILACWENDAAATAGLAGPVHRRWRERSSESWTALLVARAARGRWSGQAPFAVARAEGDGPLAVLTRATLRPRALFAFWRRAPAISRAIAANRDVLFKIGVGEAPWLQQVTFSVWPDARSMSSFARAEGPHARAVAAVRAGGWFREELYARFEIVGEEGAWGGRSPLSPERADRA